MFKWKFPNPFGRRNRKNITKKIVLGICAMDKKTKAKPMREILDRLPADLFEIKIFGDECILNQPIEAWPVVEVLITFYSTKFPTEKALEYIKLRKPFLINDLSMESTLQDRRKVYNLLEQCGIDVPRHIFVSRDEEGTHYDIEEFDEYIVINGEQLNKPFVEKPVYAEDHNIYIYYPISAGGGSKRLFRKVDDKSAEFYPHINEIRREGSYIYEEFVTTQGTDVKVYTVGPEYGHAEARKSPVVDGRVKRDAEGREQRYPVILSPTEKEMACKIVQAFRQTVCGFDILRVQGKSYCCDVNGFSFVKNSRKYYEDAAQILTEIMLNNLRQEYQLPPSIQTKRVPSPAFNPSAPNSTRAIRNRETSASFVADGSTYLPTVAMDDASSSIHGNRPPSPSPSIISDFEYGNPTMYSANQRRYETEELRSVIAIIRHGDRTPKQKMKVVISEQRYLDYYHSYVKTPKKDLKVKSKSGLVKFLEVTRDIIQDPHTPAELRRKLVQLRDVLERWEISGINRKLQMKPQKWDEDEIVEVEEWVEVDDGSSGSGFIVADGGDSNCEDIVVDSAEVSCTLGEDVNLEMRKEFTENGLIVSDTGNKMSLRPRSNTEDTNGYALGITPTTPSSVSKSLRRRRLVKIKKVVREGTGLATELLVILKWGGDLTPLGREQAEKLGERFRNENYPGDDNGGVLRLHATYRHDLKIKASDEGRVMKTAAAFTKGLLELEGQLTPILASLVTIEEKNRTMLDRGGNFEMKEEMDRCKKHLNMLQVDQEVTDELIEQIVPGCSEVTRRAFHDLGNPLEKLRRMHYLIDRLCTQLELLCIRREESGMSVDDSQVMTEYILPASSNTDVTAPSPISLNMVGINMPEVYSTASTAVTPTIPSSKVANNNNSNGADTLDTATLQLPNSNATVPIGIAEEFTQPPQILPVTQDGTIDGNNNNNIQLVPGSAGGLSDMSTNPPTMSSTTNTTNNVTMPPTEAEDLSYLNTLYLNETFDLMLERWKKLYKEFYSSKTNQYDLTKLPDVYDMIRYDILHNQHLNFTGIDELYEIAKKFEIVVVPQEYGIDAADKRYIGSKMCGALLEKIKHDLTIASGVDSGLNNQDPMLFQLDHSHAEDMRINSIGRVVRTRLYFTSESHLHTILNVFRYPKPNSPFALGKEAMEKLEEITNVSYLSQIVIRLFEDRIERGKFSCELSFSSGSTQHDPAVMATTTYPLDSPYLLAPYVYLDRSLNLFQLLGCLDDAIELYHSTDKHTINAMLFAATASSGQVSAQPLTPSMSQDAQEDAEEGGIVVHKGKSRKTGGNDGSLDAVVEGQGQEEEDEDHEKVNQSGDGCITPPLATTSISRTSLTKRSASHKQKNSSGSMTSTPMSSTCTHVREEVVDAEPDPMIDSVHATPVKEKTRRSFTASDGRKPPLSSEKPSKGAVNSQKLSINSKMFEDLTSPLPMRRNFSVTVNIDEASDNWERLEKKLFTTHPFHNKHLSMMQGGVMGGATTGSTAGISRTRQQELDLLTRRAVASQLQQQQQLAAGCVPATQNNSTFTSAAASTATAASSATTTAAAPVRVPAKRAVSHDTAVMVANMTMESIAISPTAAAAAASASKTTTAEDDAEIQFDAITEIRVMTQSPNPKSPKANKDSSDTFVSGSAQSPSALVHQEESNLPSAPLTVSSSPSLNTSLTHSRKRTGSLSADNIVLLDRSGLQERERATSELGLVSESRVLAATPTTLSAATASAGNASAGGGMVMMMIENNPVGGILTVFKSSAGVSSSSLTAMTSTITAAAADPAINPAAASDGSVSMATGIVVATGSSVASSAKESISDATVNGTTETLTTVSDSSAATPSDVIAVQRSLSDIENRRLKESLFLASDFYVSSVTSSTVSAAAVTVVCDDTANTN